MADAETEKEISAAGGRSTTPVPIPGLEARSRSGSWDSLSVVPSSHAASSPSSLPEGWHTIAHRDLLVSVDGPCARPVQSGPAQREDVIGVFRGKLVRHNITEADIHTVVTKLTVIRRWLESARPDDDQGEAGEAVGTSREASCEEPPPPPAFDPGAPSDWCYVDSPWAPHPAANFWLISRDVVGEDSLPLPPAVKLDFGDLAVIEVLLDIVSAKWRKLLLQCVGTESPCLDPNLRPIQDVVTVVDCFTQHIRPYFFNWYHTGDVIFYDLDARRRLGVERPNLTLHLQKLYDTFSHSAVFLWDEGLPKILHNLSVRVKVCSWKDCVYMAKREIDFHKIFAGHRFLPYEVQQQVVRLYKEAVVVKAKQSTEYVVESLPFFRGLQNLFTTRQYVPNPPVLRRAARSRSDPTSMAAASSPTDGSAAQNYSEMMCAGFTAGFLFECMKEVQRQLPDWQQELAFTSTFLVDLDRMTPKDLHHWDIWLDSAQPCPLHDILHPEVLANRDKSPHLR